MLTSAGTVDQSRIAAGHQHGVRHACQDATAQSIADLECLPHWPTRQQELLRLIFKTLTLRTSMSFLREPCGSS